ncbi:hypothetical protein QTP70_034544 [Hemibagrus guttatus]|uniref:Reverse transcriptase domain-containing protein n=1 Tax=Hemibagrus guttatus TaxID=175788 RepID=A0AAE0V954_9TELE|nr:hypothetical protein QTP70_034544 [Hemibagrus guttatus]
MGLVFYPLPVHGDVPYRLRLPAKYRICPTFHVSLLKPVYPSAEGAPNGGEPPPPLDIEGSPAYRALGPMLMAADLPEKAPMIGKSPAVSMSTGYINIMNVQYRSGHICSTTITLNTSVPQGCVLSPFLYSLFTHDCRPVYGSNSIIKFADDTTVIGLISDNDETAYRVELQHLVAWCADNNVLLNTSKMKELIIDFRREKGRTHDPIHINGMAVESVSSFKFLGTHISEDLSWTTNTSSLVKKAHQHLFLPKHSEEEPPVFNHPGELLPLHD